MKKMIKMSLVAAVAVAGLATTASAKPMEDAIKNVDLSGYVRYRYTNGDQPESNEYKTVVKLKSKVNDNVSMFLKVAGADSTSNTSGDADPDTTAVKEAKFIYTGNGITAIVGKQGLATPFGDAADQQGTGIVVLAPVGPVTLAAGWYTNSDAKSIYSNKLNKNEDKDTNENDIGGNNIAAVAAILKLVLLIFLYGMLK